MSTDASDHDVSTDHDHDHDHETESEHSLESLLARERTTRIVVLLSGFTMAAELVVGTWTHSLALVADGWHMATHVGALGVAWMAYLISRRLSEANHVQIDKKRLFALAGYTNALVLGFVGVVMLWESWQRFVKPENIAFSEAIPVAILGLIVNLASARLLGNHHDEHHHDHNLRAAYVHIIADAVTSVLALIALVVGRSWAILVLDPICAALGAVVVLVWAVGLLKGTVIELLEAKPRASGDKAKAKTVHS